MLPQYTKKSAEGKYKITDLAKAAESLAKLEDLYDYVRDCEQTIPTELAKLRREGKENS